jgi:hypothetical protein
MPEVLFRIPIGPDGLPVYPLGLVYFLVFLILIGLGWPLARKAGMRWKSYENLWLGLLAVLVVATFLLSRR